MREIEGDFWSVINNSLRERSSDMQESTRYCRGSFAHATDLLEEKKYDAAHRKLMNLTYLIDCLEFSGELQEIRDLAWSLIRELDLPVDDCGDYSFKITLPRHLIQDDD